MTTSLRSNLYKKGKVAVQCTRRSFLKRTHCYLRFSKQTFRCSQTCHHKHSYQRETDLKKSHCKTNISVQPHKQGLSTLSVNTHGTTCPYRTLCNHMTTTYHQGTQKNLAAIPTSSLIPPWRPARFLKIQRKINHGFQMRFEGPLYFCLFLTLY